MVSLEVVGRESKGTKVAREEEMSVVVVVVAELLAAEGL